LGRPREARPAPRLALVSSGWPPRAGGGRIATATLLAGSGRHRDHRLMLVAVTAAGFTRSISVTSPRRPGYWSRRACCCRPTTGTRWRQAARDARPAEAVNQLVAQREQLPRRRCPGGRTARVEQERGRLAADVGADAERRRVQLDGRVLLYNSARGCSSSAVGRTAAAGGAELIGLGRSIYACSTPARGPCAGEHPAALLRGAASPSRSSSRPPAAASCCARRWHRCATARTAMSGWRLRVLLDNITREYERDAAQDQLLLGLTEGSARRSATCRPRGAAGRPD